MKKSPKIQNGPKGSEAKPRQHGPLREKTQVTLRIDKDLMNEAYLQMKEDNSRITDMIERGLILALAEARHELPAWTKQVRFVLANATREEQVVLRGVAIAMKEAEVARMEGKPDFAFYSNEVPVIWAFCKAFLESRNKVANAEKCLQLYSRYGKSAEEIAKMGKL